MSTVRPRRPPSLPERPGRFRGQNVRQRLVPGDAGELVDAGAGLGHVLGNEIEIGAGIAVRQIGGRHEIAGGLGIEQREPFAQPPIVEQIGSDQSCQSAVAESDKSTIAYSSARGRKASSCQSVN